MGGGGLLERGVLFERGGLIEDLRYAIGYCNTRDEWHAATESAYSSTVNLHINRSP